jgi:hypothetical protein
MTMKAPEYLGGHARLVALLEKRAEMLAPEGPKEPEDRYAALLSRCHSSEAEGLIHQVFGELAHWQRASGKRVRQFRAKRGQTYHEAIERFVGDLLRAQDYSNASGRIYHATGKTSFDDDPVNYDVFMGVLKGLKALELVGHEQGRTRFRKIPEWGVSATLPGRASRLWATAKLVEFAEHRGIRLDNIGDHFQPEPPHNPLVLRDYATGKGANRERGQIVKNYRRTTHTKRLAADIRELNELLAGCDITGGEHHGYTRNFNNNSWRKGGRLYSVGGGYQQMPETKRLQMMINGEAVAEIDIKASFLTIYHARLGVPLKHTTDPYVEAGIQDRSIAKSWVVHSFGKSSPQVRWPSKAIEDYKKETGLDLRKVAKAKDISDKMVAAFPELKRLERYSHIWADLQFIEAEAIISTMLMLMRTHGVPSLSMHDGIIVPRSRVGLTKAILTSQFRHFVGVEPMLTVEPEEQAEVAAIDL